MALRASGLPAAGQGKSRVLTVTERQNEYRRKREKRNSVLSEKSQFSLVSVGNL